MFASGLRLQRYNKNGADSKEILRNGNPKSAISVVKTLK